MKATNFVRPQTWVKFDRNWIDYKAKLQSNFQTTNRVFQKEKLIHNRQFTANITVIKRLTMFVHSSFLTDYPPLYIHENRSYDYWSVSNNNNVWKMIDHLIADRC